LLGHPKAIILYQEALGVFWGPTVKHYVESKEWPSIGVMMNKRLLHMLAGCIRLIRRRQSDIGLMAQKKIKKKKQEETGRNRQETEEVEDQIQVHLSEQSEA
jgi:hypothetical protein